MELTEVLEARKHFNAIVKIYKKNGYSMEQIKAMTFDRFWNELTQAIEKK